MSVTHLHSDPLQFAKYLLAGDLFFPGSLGMALRVFSMLGKCSDL